MGVQFDEIVLHGQRIAYRSAGSGPVVVLVHGLAGDSTTWRHVMPTLAKHATVIAPDLQGHGCSGKPRGDYSLGNHATMLRDLLVTLGHERATFVGHSLGGGVAMQFAYQYPERCERLVLVASGGLGPDVSAFLRALAFPGVEFLIGVGCKEPLARFGFAVGSTLARVGLRPTVELEETWRSYASLADGETREAFLATLRSVVDHNGQKVNARDRLYLAQGLPTLIVWGADDSIIPVSHAADAAEAVAGSRVEIFEHAGHFPHCDDPLRFTQVIADFIATTEPAELSAAQLRLLSQPDSA